MNRTGTEKINCGLGLPAFDEKTGGLRAALLSRQGHGSIRVVFADSFENAGGVAERILGIKASLGGGCGEVAAGVNDSEIVYYGFDLPDVKAEELEKLVSGQVEGLSPLPMEQAGWSWRAGQVSLNQRRCEAAIVRKAAVDRAVGRAGTLKGALGGEDVKVKVMPGAAGFVRGLRACFGDFDRQSLVLKLGQGECVLAAVEENGLCRAWVFETSQTAGWAGLLARDAMVCLESLKDWARPVVYLVCRDQQSGAAVCEGFAGIGMESKSLEPDEGKLAALGIGGTKDAYENVEAIGLGLAAMEQAVEFDFCRVPKETGKAGVLSGRRLIGAGVALLAAVICCVLAMGWLSRRELEVVRKAMNREYEGISGAVVLERAALRESIARERPDLMEVLGAIGSSMPEGMLIDSFAFKRGQPVRLTGRAKNFEAVYGFQKTLDGKSGISQVRLWEPRVEDKDKQVLFRITFNYRHFSEGVVR